MIKDPNMGKKLFSGITEIISNEIKINIVPNKKHNKIMQLIIIKYATYYK